MDKKGNTVGSFGGFELWTDKESAYILGLWCADGYWRSSSIGITNVDERIIDRFTRFLERYFSKDRIKLRIYNPLNQHGIHPMRLAKQTAYQLYVNSRPLLRAFRLAEQSVTQLPKEYTWPYFAGRFDGDGSVAHNLRNDLRIVYSNQPEALGDQALLKRVGVKTSVYHYSKARTYVVYVRCCDANRFITSIRPYSVKIKITEAP